MGIIVGFPGWPEFLDQDLRDELLLRPLGG